jgi:hypothetical protein
MEIPGQLSAEINKQCQEVSRKAELALSLAILPDEHSERDFTDWQKRVADARRRYPELKMKVPVTTREARTIVREMKIEKPPGVLYRELPLVQFDASIWTELFNVAAKKMVLAQHYRCFKRPLSREGRIYAKLVPNAHQGDGEWLREMLKDLPQLEMGRHGNEDLGDQILTRWDASRDGNLGCFITRIQGMFVVIGMTGESREFGEFMEENGGEPPFP